MEKENFEREKATRHSQGGPFFIRESFCAAASKGKGLKHFWSERFCALSTQHNHNYYDKSTRV